MNIKVRFAPSPTGYLHVGNVRTALVNWLYARARGGRFLLRFDDTDEARSRDEYVHAIEQDLRWLGLEWDDVAHQSHRYERYNDAVRRLKDAGRLYACFETPDELEAKRKLQLARRKPPVYDRAGLTLTEARRAALEAEGRTPHWRFKLDVPARVTWQDMVRGDTGVDMDSLSDPVLIRADGTYLYMLPSVVDDIDLAITHVMRGEDHVTNSAVQVQLFEALGSKAPQFAHFPLIAGASGEGLSKREGALSVRELREEEGLEPMAILSLLARLGTSDPVEPRTSHEDLVAGFAVDRFGRATAKFDVQELHNLNARVLHGLPFTAVRDRLHDLGLDGVNEAFWLTVRPNLKRLGDALDWWHIVNGPVDPVIGDRDFIDAAITALPQGPWDHDTWKIWADAVKAATGAKGRALFMPLRQALTGRDHGPEMNALLPLIGPAKTRARLSGERV
ncbi:MAG: glutamate--tRNA ligase [Sphingomonadales bacterium]